MHSAAMAALAAAKSAANRILGFYDTIPAMDQEAFAAGLVELLSIYPQPVLERAISPSRGLPANVAYPNLAKFKEKLDEWHGEHLDDMRRRGVLPGKEPQDLRRLAPPSRLENAPQGHFANVHIPASHARYGSLCEWAKTAERKFWKYGKSSTGVDGIWIPYNVWDEGTAALKKSSEFATMTVNQLRGYYAPPTSEDAA